jgi:NADH-quinone oxidoreductase subunit C
VPSDFLDTLATTLVPAAPVDGSPGSPVLTSGGIAHGVLVLHVEPPALLALVERLRSEFDFDLFLDVTAVDWPGAPLRFEVVHHFYSTTHKVRVRVKQRVSEAEPVVASLVTLYGSAGYMERECHDMYGIRFRGNDDLRPILLYEGFTGHPLRKDYPKQLEQPLIPYLPPQRARVS